MPYSQFRKLPRAASHWSIPSIASSQISWFRSSATRPVASDEMKDKAVDLVKMAIDGRTPGGAVAPLQSRNQVDLVVVGHTHSVVVYRFLTSLFAREQEILRGCPHFLDNADPCAASSDRRRAPPISGDMPAFLQRAPPLQACFFATLVWYTFVSPIFEGTGLD